ncbi:hypothetical protein [Lactobacillus thailandensis]|uniref:HD domain-containing protein n=1 Tax=Lacticaseibacillus thailandensis TaxID=381741 RepID=UPI0007050412
MLSAAEQERFDRLYAYTESVLAADRTGHSLDHINRVLANAVLLLHDTPAADTLTVVAAATLHDTYDDKLVDNVPAARRKTAAMLADQGFDQSSTAEILGIIDQMSYRYSLDHDVTLDLNGQLVQDADRLDAIGAIGIARTFYYGGAHGSQLYGGEVREHLSGAEYRHSSSVLNHFDEKLFKLVDQLNTPAAQKLGAHRQQVMRDFVAEFKAEVNGAK